MFFPIGKKQKVVIFAEILKNMKKAILAAVIFIAMSLTATAQNSSETSKVSHLTYKEFLQKVWDFEKDSQTFVYKGKLPAIIDFYADWCGPCRKTAPVLEKLANEYDGKLLVYKINVDQERDLATVFQVRSIPALLFIPTEGQPMMQVGAMNEAQFKDIIGKYLVK